MKPLHQILLAAALLLGAAGSRGSDIGIDLEPDPANPANPTMGNWMHFQSVVRNAGTQTLDGLVAWISLVDVTPGHERPMDLEDWSALKAVTGTTLAAGTTLTTDWPMRLIQGGDYRVVISATDRGGQAVYTSPTLQFHVAAKPVVESARILPVALGVPLLLAGAMGYRAWRRAKVG